jgi:hypothetical protein
MSATELLDKTTAATLPTSKAAAHLGRKPQTLRAWAATGKGPIQPRKINGRLAWFTEDLRRLLARDAGGAAMV